MNSSGISVIICTYNSGPRIKEVLSFLLKQKGMDDIPWEVIVVNNASTDNTADETSSQFKLMPRLDLKLTYEKKNRPHTCT